MAARSKGGRLGPEMGWAGSESSRAFPLLHVGPCHQFLFGLDEAPCLARFDTFLTRSLEFFIFSGLVPMLLRVMFDELKGL
jgi:hypothetical protein